MNQLRQIYYISEEGKHTHQLQWNKCWEQAGYKHRAVTTEWDKFRGVL